MSGNSRRQFLRRIGLLAGASMVPSAKRARATAVTESRQTVSDSTEAICRARFDLAERESLSARPIGEVMVAVGTSFIGTPYAAHTLEVEGEERLILNLQGLDCVTFVENSLALSRCVKLGFTTLDAFAAEIQRIRYRGGILSGYPSRLHYFSEWILDNARRGIVRDITGEIGGVPYDKTIDFMSTHRDRYPQLADDEVYGKIRMTESVLSSARLRYLPKEALREHVAVLESGDIVAITTSVGGLDIIHTGIAVHTNGDVRYLHAPLSGGSVRVSDEPLAEYLMARKGQTGIMVARPLEPQ